MGGNDKSSQLQIFTKTGNKITKAKEGYQRRE